MDSLLQHAFFERACAQCGGSLRVTLYDVLNEGRVRDEWQPARPCSVCAYENRPLLTAIPEEAVQGLAQAWDRVVQAARDRGLELQVG